MAKNLLKFINKNLIVINFLLIIFILIFFLLNKNKFDTYKAYLTYNFEERNWLLRDANLNFVRNYLSDLHFSSEIYDSNILKKGINLSVNIAKETLNFSFSSKRSKFLNWHANSDDENINSINNFIEASLDNYHKNLSKNFLLKKNSLNEPLKDFSSLDPSVLSIEKINNLMKDKYLFDEYLEILNDGKKIIKNQGYNIKYRRLFLNTDEYIISCLILIFLFNLIVKNFRAIIS
tara:strand:- start:70 stop:771 length:702 start_codon:yes stop_codon:yes gene_type:complete